MGTMDAVPTRIHAFALGALNRVYNEVWHRYPFRDAKLVSVSVSVSEDTEEVVMPIDVDAVRAMRSTSEALFPFNEVLLNNFDPGMFSETGTPYNYYNLPDAPVESQPASASTLVFVSSDDDDDGTVRIFGTVDNDDVYEEITLTGTSDVTTANSFSEILSISKPETDGWLTVTDGSTTLGKVAPWDTAAAYRRIRPVPIPNADVTYYVEATRRFMALTSDNDTLLLPRCENAIFDMLVAELYDLNDQAERAAAERLKGAERMMAALNFEEQIDREDRRRFPAMSWFGDDSYSPVDTSYTGTGV